MRICVLASGSKGNATYVEGEHTKLLIDCGLTALEIEKRLQLINVNPQEIGHILVTHEHSDHIKGLGAFARKYNSKVYANPDSWTYMQNKIGPLTESQKIGIYHNDFYINELAISPFDLSHDSKHCLGFSLINGNSKFSTATDLGFIDDKIISILADSNLVVLECNHDINTLNNNPKYPKSLKDRILSKKGHLNNQDSANAVLQMLGYGVRGVICAHLSQENNSPQLVQQALLNTVATHGGDLAKEIHIEIADQDKVTKIYKLRG